LAPQVPVTLTDLATPVPLLVTLTLYVPLAPLLTDFEPVTEAESFGAPTWPVQF